MDMVQVQILGLYLDPTSGAATVLLGEAEHVERVLPIMIGPAEAQAIAIGVEQIVLPRPGTHDLLLSMLAAAHGRLLGVDIIGLSEGTFLAELRVETDHGTERVDARPSDGMALAVRADVPVSVDREIFDEAGVAVVHEPGEPFAEEEVERIMSEFQDFLETAEPSDFEPPSTGDVDDEGGDHEGRDRRDDRSDDADRNDHTDREEPDERDGDQGDTDGGDLW